MTLYFQFAKIYYSNKEYALIRRRIIEFYSILGNLDSRGILDYIPGVAGVKNIVKKVSGIIGKLGK